MQSDESILKLKESVEMFRRTDRMHRCLFEKRTTELFGIHFSQHMTLMFISRNENVSQKTIAEHFQISPSAVAVMLKKLEAKNLILRTTSDEDSRRNHIRITDEGLGMVSETHKLFTEIDYSMFEGLSDSEMDAFIGCLEKIQQNLKKAEEKLNNTAKESIK